MVGFKRSRAIWDATRRDHYNSLYQRCRAWVQAFLYELQPVRWEQLLEWGDRVTASFRPATTATAGDRNIPSTPMTTLLAWANGWDSLVRWIFELLTWIVTRTRRHYVMLLGAGLYYMVLRWVHEVLHAGPVLLMCTALGIIFTVGLDDGSANTDGNRKRSSLSAYSVFNRGFERILGSVDADELLAQHVGGMGGLMMGRMDRDHDNDEDNDNRHHNARVGAERRPRGQAEPVNNPHNHHPAPDPIANPPNVVDRPPNNNNNNNANNRARKSGKKARRRNLEVRREMRRQREAAVMMGFGDGDGPGELEAMQRLLDDEQAPMYAAENDDDDDDSEPDDR